MLESRSRNLVALKIQVLNFRIADRILDFREGGFAIGDVVVAEVKLLDSCFGKFNLRLLGHDRMSLLQFVKDYERIVIL